MSQFKDSNMRKDVAEKEEKQNSVNMNQQVALTSSVKSTAVVKYSNCELPTTYQRLQVNTDLNEPPSNWLHGNSRWEHYIRNATASAPKEHPFTSFKMAHCFPDLAGEVDVITDSENIKRLLKIPYSKGQVSMMVHRVGNTLLLDEFDVHKHLLRQQQDDWKWLRHFYYDTVLKNMEAADKFMVKKNKRRDHLQSLHMYSKFLYYSVADDTTECPVPGSEHKLGASTAQCLLDQGIPDPLRKPEPAESDHQRTVQWTFEDLRMLIGTDLPIFGGGSRPCVSLKLRDMKKPISILTGLDYWLDNLMCNVPELAMCYHDDGIVKAYELVKTEDIPGFDQSKFEPQVVKDIAQNILSFLRSKATLEGHTYWLFKGQNDAVVKLYDLTTLCEGFAEKCDNPYSIPVGMLLYRVARNLRQTMGRKKAATIRKLLTECLALLDKEAYSQVVTSAHYLLSDLYVSDDITSLEDDSTEEDLDGCDSVTSEESDDNDVVPSSAARKQKSPSPDDDDKKQHREPPENKDQPPAPAPEEKDGSPLEEQLIEPASSVEVSDLRVAENVKRPSGALDIVRYPPIVGGPEERCRECIKHIAEGLSCLDKNASSYDSSKHRVDAQATCNPDMAIPLSYSPIQTKNGENSKETRAKHSVVQNPKKKMDTNNSKKMDTSRSSLSPENIAAKQLSLLKSTMPKNSWHILSKTLLLKKGATVYHWMAYKAFNKDPDKDFAGDYGTALKNLRIALYCFCAMENLIAEKRNENGRLLADIFSLIGDCLIHFVPTHKKWPEYSKQFTNLNPDDITILESTSREITTFDHSYIDQFPSCKGDCLEHSISAYRVAVRMLENVHCADGESQLVVLKKRLGNAYNQHATQLKGQAAVGSENSDGLWRESSQYYEAAFKCFDSIHDVTNSAVVQNNLAMLKREQIRIGEHNCHEDDRSLYKQAQTHYLSALSILNKRERGPEIWDAIRYDLANTYYDLAVTIQECSPKRFYSTEELEKDVTEYMTKALKYCDADVEGERQSKMQYLAGTIHHRLASLYHNSLRETAFEHKKRFLRTIAEHHYERAHHYFSKVTAGHEQLRMLLERVAMVEYHMKNQMSITAKHRSFAQRLSLLLECERPIRLIIENLEKNNALGVVSVEMDYSEESEKLINLFKGRLSEALHDLVKLTMGKNGEKFPHQMYKIMYATFLKTKKDGSLIEQYKNIHDALEHLKKTSAESKMS